MKTIALSAFWTGVLWISYTYVGYPMLLWVIGLFRAVSPEKRENYLPTVSVLIAARNEEQDIGWKVVETLAWDYPHDRLEVLIASDSSEDRTDEIVGGICDPRLKLIRMERRGGKGRALNRLAELAKGELLFFTDANSHVGPDCLRLLTAHFADPQVGCVTGHSYAGLDIHSPVNENGTALYWGQELLIKRLESRLGAVLACDGAIFAIRHSLYTPVSPDLANDLELPLKIFDSGYYIRFEPRARVIEKDTISPSQGLSRQRRICAQGALAMMHLRTTFNGFRMFQFASGKIFRWLTLIPLAMILCSSVALATRPLFGAAAFVQMTCYAAAAAGSIQAARSGRVSRCFSTPLSLSITALGAFIGFCDAVRGRRFDVWDSPSATRGSEPLSATQVEHPL